MSMFLLGRAEHRKLCVCVVVNAGVLRKGCVLRCGASASNRKGECGGGVVYQRHRRTLMAKLKGQLQYET